MGGAISSVASAVTKPLGSAVRGVTDAAGVTVSGDPGSSSVNAQSYQLSQAEKDYEAELKKRFLGEGPSVAQNALKQATDRNIANIAGQAAAQRTNQALVQREALRAQGLANQESANQSAQLRAQEMQNAGSLYGDVVNRERLAAQEYEATAAGVNRANVDRVTNQNNNNASRMTNLYSGIGQAIASDERLKTNVQPINVSAGENASKQKRQQLLAEGSEQSTLDPVELKAANFKSTKKPEETKVTNTSKNMPDSVVVKSDEKSKTEKDSANPSKDFLSKLKAYTYEYKDPSLPGAAPGKQMGVMAQDLEKTEIGKQMVADTPSGKMVDFSKAIAPMLASQVVMNEELEQLKSALSKRSKKKETSNE